MDEKISNRKPYSQKEYGFQQIYLGTVSKRKRMVVYADKHKGDSISIIKRIHNHL